KKAQSDTYTTTHRLPHATRLLRNAHTTTDTADRLMFPGLGKSDPNRGRVDKLTRRGGQSSIFTVLTRVTWCVPTHPFLPPGSP
ncbi:hypothetical protein TNCV_2812201, partial [Trichonephila clavipes]